MQQPFLNLSNCVPVGSSVPHIHCLNICVTWQCRLSFQGVVLDIRSHAINTENSSKTNSGTEYDGARLMSLCEQHHGQVHL